MANKNIILEVDESTSLMVDKIKSSILSDFLENIASLRHALTGLLENNSDIIENMSRSIMSKNDMDRFSDNIAGNIDIILDEVAELSDKIQNMVDFPDPKPLIASIEESTRNIGSFHENFGIIIGKISESREENVDNLSNIREILKDNKTQADAKFEALINGQKALIDESTEVLHRNVQDIAECLDKLEKILSESQTALKECIEKKAQDLSLACEANFSSIGSALDAKTTETLRALNLSSDRQHKVITDASLQLKDDIAEKFLNSQKNQNQFASKLFEDTHRRHEDITSKLDTVVESIRKSLQAINLNLESISEQQSKCLDSLYNAIKEIVKNQEKFEQKAKSESVEINRKLDSLMAKMDNLQSSADARHDTITEKLKQILYTVTPFWKKKKINE